ncbi:MAG: hypothetical protein WHS83_02150 [Chloroflexus sp.]|uniref:hypothetical protein n=1 Tax=Chloroflexus sp. TaxID=1904827 RepID=UPI0030A35807
MAAALQTLRHAPDERARQSTQRVIDLEMAVSPPRCHTGSLGAGYTLLGDWQAFMSLGDGRVARRYSLMK